MNYNYNYFNAYSDPYFKPTSFDSNITNSSYHNFNQPSIPDWSYPNQYMPQSQSMKKTRTIITTLHRVSGDATPPSLTINSFTNK